MRFLVLIAGFILALVMTHHLTAQTHYRVSEEHRNPHLKAEACARDGLSPETCRKQEADHVVPLCAGGPDVLDNIQEQPCDLWIVRNGIPECEAGEAKRKDDVEKLWCREIHAGKATREEAAEYFTNHKRCPPATEGCW